MSNDRLWMPDLPCWVRGCGDDCPSFGWCCGRLSSVAVGRPDRSQSAVTSSEIRMSVAGKWQVAMDTPIGKQKFTWDLQQAGAGWKGSMDGQAGVTELTDIKVAGGDVSFGTRVNSPMGTIDLAFSGAATGDQIS